jgi:hypothetical protein
MTCLRRRGGLPIGARYLRFDHLAIRFRASSGCLTAILAATVAPLGSRPQAFTSSRGENHEAITLAISQTVMFPDAYGGGGGWLRGALAGDGGRPGGVRFRSGRA